MTIHSDITIIGAGLVGMTAACAFARLGLNVIVIDSADLDVERKKESDGRTCAIAAGSADIFKKIGVWDDMQTYAGEIKDILVTDGNSPIFLHYDHSIIGDRPMGYIIENFYLREALFNRISDEESITILAPTRYTDIKFCDEECTVTLSNGDMIISKLIIAADGKNSNARKLANIRTHDWNYNQSGIVCTITHEKHHQFTAQERFLPQGPFAVLPMHGGYHSSLVWTEKSDLVPVYMEMSKPEIEEQITLRTGEYLGKITLAGRMYSYPLSLCKAKRYIGKRLALVGDAAHAMHPLAGQGFNVGIRDVDKLVALISNERLEMNLTSTMPQCLDPLLKNYEEARMSDSISLLGITDILNRMFSNNISPLRNLRRLGMAAVNHATPLKKFLMKHAMGVK
jgi:2-octaprenyl-6-methoxyphenol hydroxylase